MAASVISRSFPSSIILSSPVCSSGAIFTTKPTSFATLSTFGAMTDCPRVFPCSSQKRTSPLVRMNPSSIFLPRFGGPISWVHSSKQVGTQSTTSITFPSESPYQVHIAFHSDGSSSDSHFAGSVDVVTFGSEQYKWHTDLKLIPVGGSADPDGPAVRSTISAGVDTIYVLPKASVTVIRGKLAATPSPAKPM